MLTYSSSLSCLGIPLNCIAACRWQVFRTTSSSRSRRMMATAHPLACQCWWDAIASDTSTTSSSPSRPLLLLVRCFSQISSPTEALRSQCKDDNAAFRFWWRGRQQISARAAQRHRMVVCATMTRIARVPWGATIFACQHRLTCAEVAAGVSRPNRRNRWVPSMTG